MGRVRDLRLVVVTGAGSGIGRATAEEFAKDGATMLVTDVDEATATETAELIRSAGGQAAAYRLDVADAAAWEAFASDVVVEHGVTDVLVNNAGIAMAGPFLDHTAADWERLLGVNLFGVIHGCRVFGRQMVERGEGGHIVNIGSMNSFTRAVNMSSYSVSKAAVKMLSECLRSEFADKGVGVSVMMPGMINTNIVRDGEFVAPAGTEPEFVDFVRGSMQRAFSRGWPPSRVARAIVRAVRFDLAVVPVGPEAYAGYAMSRVSPRALSFMTRQVLSQERLEQARRWLRR